ncbi:hypothetical protein QBC45DRAFT_78096 [Copromyces sp. CBS 386.78]|nr:hypothetical protein QBC45DRAFT_78096 [Copromyces sp. CBS 386.78]
MLGTPDAGMFPTGQTAVISPFRQPPNVDRSATTSDRELSPEVLETRTAALSIISKMSQKEGWRKDNLMRLLLDPGIRLTIVNGGGSGQTVLAIRVTPAGDSRPPFWSIPYERRPREAVSDTISGAAFLMETSMGTVNAVGKQPRGWLSRLPLSPPGKTDRNTFLGTSSDAETGRQGLVLVQLGENREALTFIRSRITYR